MRKALAPGGFELGTSKLRGCRSNHFATTTAKGLLFKLIIVIIVFAVYHVSIVVAIVVVVVVVLTSRGSFTRIYHLYASLVFLWMTELHQQSF